MLEFLEVLQLPSRGDPAVHPDLVVVEGVAQAGALEGLHQGPDRDVRRDADQGIALVLGAGETAASRRATASPGGTPWGPASPRPGLAEGDGKRLRGSASRRSRPGCPAPPGRWGPVAAPQRRPSPARRGCCPAREAAAKGREGGQTRAPPRVGSGSEVRPRVGPGGRCDDGGAAGADGSRRRRPMAGASAVEQGRLAGCRPTAPPRGRHSRVARPNMVPHRFSTEGQRGEGSPLPQRAKSAKALVGRAPTLAVPIAPRTGATRPAATALSGVRLRAGQHK